MSTIPKNDTNNNAILKCCTKFFNRFHLGKLLKMCNASKEKGIPTSTVFSFLIGMIFSERNLYNLIKNEPEKVPFGKDVVYRFLNSMHINWERFLFAVATAVLPEIQKLTSEERKNVLIIDDSPYSRNRSKKVELLSKCYDHVTHKYYKGFALLTLGWSDGQTFLPLKFSLVGSKVEKNRYEESHVSDKRTLAYKRRQSALTEKPALLLRMLKDVKGTAAQAQYVLFDSWFSTPSAIVNIKQLGYDVVARLKKLNTFQYLYSGEKLPISKIYSQNRKRRGMSKYLLSVMVEVSNKENETVAAKIVYIRDRNNSKKWIALITTDCSLSEEEVIELYGKRWEIEPFFKMSKSYLHLSKEFQSRSYDAMTAHTTVVFVRYILLALENRENKDERSICDIFFVLCKELDDISFNYAFELIQSTMIQSAISYLNLREEQIEDFLKYFIAHLPAYIKDKLALTVCES